MDDHTEQYRKIIDTITGTQEQRKRPIGYDLDHNPIWDIEDYGKKVNRDDPRRFIGQDKVGGYLVSTVFLFVDHNFFDAGLPILYETMIFDEDQKIPEHRLGRDIYCERTRTREQALEVHNLCVESLLQGKVPTYETGLDDDSDL